MPQEEESSNPFNSAAIFEPKSGSILLMKAFFFEADMTTSVRIAKKNIGSENVFLKEKEVIKKYIIPILLGFLTLLCYY